MYSTESYQFSKLSSVSSTKKKEKLFGNTIEKKSKFLEFFGIDQESGLIYLRQSLDYDNPAHAKSFLLYGK